MTYLPRDRNERSIQTLRPRAGGAHQGTAGAVSTRLGPFDADTVVISIWAASPIRYQTGGATVTAAADDHYLDTRERHTVSLGGDDRHSHLAILREGAEDVTVEVSELE